MKIFQTFKYTKNDEIKWRLFVLVGGKKKKCCKINYFSKVHILLLLWLSLLDLFKRCLTISVHQSYCYVKYTPFIYKFMVELYVHKFLKKNHNLSNGCISADTVVLSNSSQLFLKAKWLIIS